MPDEPDYSNQIPAAVRRQAERADQIAREMGVANTPGLDEYQAEQSAAAAVAGGSGQVDGGQPTVGEQGGEASPPQPAEPGDWQQRYRTLQGKYDAEVPSLRNQIVQLQTVIASMQSAPPVPPAPTPVPQRIEPTISNEDRETWGDDLPAAVNRWVDNRLMVYQAENQSLREELNQLRTNQGETNIALTQQAAERALDRDPEIGPYWRTLNHDPEFNAWLNQIDPFSGQLRMGLIREAYAQGDVLRTGQFFRSYLMGHTAPSGTVVPTHTGANGGGNGAGASAGRVNLTSLVAPGRSSVSGNNGGAQPEKRTWTNQDIGAFYRDVNRGMYRGREAEKLNLEQDIFAAAREGRVVQQ